MSDEVQRRQFCESIYENFSVIAPAGVGKTFSIVERIATLANQSPELLRYLCVVTYTKKAAEALRCRCEERLKQHTNYSSFAAGLRQSFFGTIHSLCWHHIQQLEPYKSYELLEDDTALREAFLEEIFLNDPLYKTFHPLLRFVDIDILLPLTEHVPPYLKPEPQILHLPTLDLSAIYHYTPEKRNQAAIVNIQRETKMWEQQYQQQAYLSIPTCTRGGEVFKQTFFQTFAPLYRALGQQAFELLKQLSTCYFQYRCQQGLLKHADFIFKAQQNLATPQARAFFADKTLSIILDEAQDTDEEQFKYIQTLLQFNPQNRFSMVGDPQQAIYGSRVNVQDYLKFHKQAIQNGLCKSLIFSKTFRCPEAITTVLNERFPRILNPHKEPQQVTYVPLTSASKTQGRWEWITVPLLPQDGEDVITYEAQVLSEFLRDHTQNIAQNLSQICILCPRKEWLNDLQQPLEAQGWHLQLYSSATAVRSNPLFCACLALIHRINYPHETFEELGLLRNLFHYSEKFLMENKEVFNQGQLLAQQQLNKLKSQVLFQTLCKGVASMINFFQSLCPSLKTDGACLELLMNEAFKTQSQKQSWAALEKRLQALLTTSIAVESEPIPGAIQCYSCHKAKGLEWRTVILPFFYRPIRYKTQSYPYLFHQHLLWNKYDPIYSEIIAERKRELQRLLYVSLTRSKQDLFIIQDGALWPKTKSEPSFGTLYDGF